jgi:hypothetical protein
MIQTLHDGIDQLAPTWIFQSKSVLTIGCLIWIRASYYPDVIDYSDVDAILKQET